VLGPFVVGPSLWWFLLFEVEVLRHLSDVLRMTAKVVLDILNQLWLVIVIMDEALGAWEMGGRSDRRAT